MKLEDNIWNIEIRPGIANITHPRRLEWSLQEIKNNLELGMFTWSLHKSCSELNDESNDAKFGPFYFRLG